MACTERAQRVEVMFEKVCYNGNMNLRKFGSIIFALEWLYIFWVGISYASDFPTFYQKVRIPRQFLFEDYDFLYGAGLFLIGLILGIILLKRKEKFASALFALSLIGVLPYVLLLIAFIHALNNPQYMGDWY